jgi:hypothetical protein
MRNPENKEVSKLEEVFDKLKALEKKHDLGD